MRHDGSVSRRRASRLAIAAIFAAFLVGPNVRTAAAAEELLLPDLAMLAPFQFHITTSSSGRKLMRFTTVMVNIGRGPFQLYGYDTDGAKKGDTLNVRQQIKRSDGTFMLRDTTATMNWADDGHNHWHLNDFQRFVLNNLDGTHLRDVRKTGFCAFDTYYWRSKLPAYYTIDRKSCLTAKSGRVLMGVSRLWGDVYRWNIAFQWIDVTGLPIGNYRLNVSADAPRTTGGRFLESNESNNLASAKIHIGKTTVTVLSHSANP